LEFRILGPLEVVNDGRILPLGGSQERALLALLLLSANRVVSAEHLTEDLWGDRPPEGVTQALRVGISRLRKALREIGAEGALVTQAPGYLLRIDPEALDAARFEALVAGGRAQAGAGQHEEAGATFREALALWRGPVLADLADAPFARAEAARLEEARLAATEERVDADLSCGRHAELTAELDALTQSHPLRENLWAQRMLALYRSGRQAEALRAYQDLRLLLGEELGIEPSAPLRRLESAILRHEAELDWLQPTRVPSSGDGPEPSRPAPTPGGLVIILFTDLVGSTALVSQSGDEEAQRVLAAHHTLLTEAVAAHGGHEVKWLGDGLMVSFPSAADAVRCAIAMQQASRRPVRGQRLAIRIGLSAGEAFLEDTDYFGTPVIVARRLCERAEAGQILCTPVVRDLLTGRAGFSFVDLGKVALKGVLEPVGACEVHYDAAPSAWRETYERLRDADLAARLGPEDLEALAEASWWCGQLEECITAHERAHAAHAAAGHVPQAAFVALKLARDYEDKLDHSIASGWQRRAERLLEGEPESPEHGHLALVHARVGLEEGKFEVALAEAERAVDIGIRFGNRDLQAEGMMYQGKVLVAMGQVASGLALLDEANAAAVCGELGPMATANVYCTTISTCRDLADYRRAGEWTQMARRWCEQQAISGFPGICRVYHAEVMRLRGAWGEAEQEVRRACKELGRFVPRRAAAAFYQLGEIRLRIGDLGAAEEAFRQAHELCWNPEPGLSLLRLAQGDVIAAAASIRRVLSGQTYRLGRAMLLPAQVDIAIAAGDLQTAREATDELASIAEAYGSPALVASAHSARGALKLAEGEPGVAMDSLRRAVHMWQEVDAPYEVARARVLLAASLEAQGDDYAAEFERSAALRAFERVGALADANRTAQLLGV
jgi:DNA-binding SARP family transcriptional activator/class 3 adenylate cyclase